MGTNELQACKLAIGDGGEHGFKHKWWDHEYMGTNKLEACKLALEMVENMGSKTRVGS
jgi:hypothetical protein